MGRLRATSLLLAVVAAGLLPTACGGSSSELVPGTTADQITSNLDHVRESVKAGNCEEAEEAVAAVSNEVEGLEKVDPQLKSALKHGAIKLSEVVSSCRSGEEKELEAQGKAEEEQLAAEEAEQESFEKEEEGEEKVQEKAEEKAEKEAEKSEQQEEGEESGPKGKAKGHEKQEEAGEILGEEEEPPAAGKGGGPPAGGIGPGGPAGGGD